MKKINLNVSVVCGCVVLIMYLLLSISAVTFYMDTHYSGDIVLSIVLAFFALMMAFCMTIVVVKNVENRTLVRVRNITLIIAMILGIIHVPAVAISLAGIALFSEITMLEKDHLKK